MHNVRDMRHRASNTIRFLNRTLETNFYRDRPADEELEVILDAQERLNRFAVLVHGEVSDGRGGKAGNNSSVRPTEGLREVLVGLRNTLVDGFGEDPRDNIDKSSDQVYLATLGADLTKASAGFTAYVADRVKEIDAQRFRGLRAS